MIEDDKLIISDYDVISELTTFIQKSDTFSAEDGCNDDLAMCLVIFSWLATQPYFRELTSNDVRKRIFEDQREAIEQDMAPFGFILDGLTDPEAEFVDAKGDYWMVADNTRYYGDTVDTPTRGGGWNADEYGDKSYMWEYQ